MSPCKVSAIHDSEFVRRGKSTICVAKYRVISRRRQARGRPGAVILFGKRTGHSRSRDSRPASKVDRYQENGNLIGLGRGGSNMAGSWMAADWVLQRSLTSDTATFRRQEVGMQRECLELGCGVVGSKPMSCPSQSRSRFCRFRFRSEAMARGVIRQQNVSRPAMVEGSPRCGASWGSSHWTALGSSGPPRFAWDAA